ncbi:MAG: response regulator transcription factor [Bryobacteraceae bacterium]
MIRVFILAESTDEARGLASLLAEEDRVEVIGTEPDDESGASFTHAGARPDVALVTGRSLVTELPFEQIPVVLLSDGPVEEWDHRGPVRSWLPPQASPGELVVALMAASQGLMLLTPAQAEVIFNVPEAAHRVVSPPRTPQVMTALAEPLTPRETQVLRMMAEGLGNKEIAGQLGISDHTAKFHVASILGKLNAATRTEAVTMGIKRGLVPI